MTESTSNILIKERFEDSSADIDSYIYLNGELKARDLEFCECNREHAIALNKIWHSRLPHAQKSPWQFAFKAHYNGLTYAVALWNNPCSRMLPKNWIELRRLAISADAPKNTASRFLASMTRYFKQHHPEKERLISYQDTAVHEGTIYKASGWEIGYYSKPINRDRTEIKKGTNRLYRKNTNGKTVDKSPKIRWEKSLKN
jgi:hypothetical protein